VTAAIAQVRAAMNEVLSTATQTTRGTWLEVLAVFVRLGLTHVPLAYHHVLRQHDVRQPH
jgi:hypothetical protein